MVMMKTATAVADTHGTLANVIDVTTADKDMDLGKAMGLYKMIFKRINII